VTHVLLEKNLNSGKDIRHWLSRWGMTMGSCDPSQPNFQWPTVLECDLVIMSAGTAETMGADHPASENDSLAPVILLGVSASLLLARDAWQVLPQPNPDAQQLRMAVQTCLEQVALLRHGPAAGQDREDFLSFLGHEMRSPLTATKTALEVLQGDLGGLGSDEGPANPQLKMLDIALRNVRRLHHTVEWSQELMASSPVQQNIQLRDVEGGQLEEALEKKHTSFWDAATKPLNLHTDTDALSMVMDQVVRAFHFAIPQCQPLWSAQCSAEEQGALILTLTPARGSVQDGAPRVSRLGLTSSDMQGDSAKVELERLVRFVVSGVLVSRLGLGIEVMDCDEEDAGIRIQVPAATDAAQSTETVGQLLTPA